MIVTESVGRDPQAVAALIEFAELMAIPVIEGRAAAYANFPKSHPLHLGTNIGRAAQGDRSRAADRKPRALVSAEQLAAERARWSRSAAIR